MVANPLADIKCRRESDWAGVLSTCRPPRWVHLGKKRARLPVTGAGHIPGDDLLSQDLSSHYHWRCSVSLPGSEWDRVVPPRSGHQRAALFEKGRTSGDLSDLEVQLRVYSRVLRVQRKTLRLVLGSYFQLSPFNSQLLLRPLSDIHTEKTSFSFHDQLTRSFLQFTSSWFLRSPYLAMTSKESSRTDD